MIVSLFKYFRETEQKREIRFQNNGNEVAYENYKRYEFSPEHSCDGCRQDDLVVVPNSVALGALSGMLDPAYSCDDTCKLIIDIGLLLLGEAPFNTVKFIELTYDGYDDAFLTFAHSELFDALGNLFNNGSALVSINIPKMERMAYFYQYNNSNDENYLIKTGKADIDDLGKIVKWADSKLLPATWWSTVQARMINGSEAGSFNEPNLKKDSVIPFFQSFMCRSFYAVYKKESKVEGIPCYTFEVPKDVYDTTIDENIGFRYKNQEKINYFEEWNPCPNKSLSTTPNCPPDVFIDCSKKRNFCHECCQGNKVDGTFLLPPGFFPLACYPGKNETPPFTALYSAPHYHYAPEVILDTVRGMSPPVEEDHSPFLFDHEPVMSFTV
uniref:Lipase_3 domain-containing protein n=1 Tax=Syphacia muris TaxID=451379 RepID=A0A0N5AH19_9BILA